MDRIDHYPRCLAPRALPPPADWGGHTGGSDPRDWALVVLAALFIVLGVAFVACGGLPTSAARHPASETPYLDPLPTPQPIMPAGVETAALFFLTAELSEVLPPAPQRVRWVRVAAPAAKNKRRR